MSPRTTAAEEMVNETYEYCSRVQELVDAAEMQKLWFSYFDIVLRAVKKVEHGGERPGQRQVQRTLDKVK